MGQLRRRGRLLKEASENLGRQTAVEDQAGAQTDRSGRRLGNTVVVLPPPWLFGQGMDNFFPKYNALKML